MIVMIAQITGTVVKTIPNPIIIDVHGVGYAVYVPQKFQTTVAPGTTITVHTHTYVREDALQLFGFATFEDLTLFEMLLSVSGIGPKTALAVMDRGSTAIQKAIASADVEFFMAVPRLGKKNAQKIIIELKNKLGAMAELDLAHEPHGDTKEIFEALIGMGFERKEVKDIMNKLPDGPIEVKIKYALKMLG